MSDKDEYIRLRTCEAKLCMYMHNGYREKVQYTHQQTRTRERGHYPPLIPPVGYSRSTSTGPPLRSRAERRPEGWATGAAAGRAAPSSGPGPRTWQGPWQCPAGPATRTSPASVA